MLLALLLAFLAAPPQESEYRISADVDWVVLSASVKDRRGEFVPNLQKGNFTVLENGLPQQIRYFSHEDIPVTVGLVMDSSASMHGKRLETIDAATAFLEASNPRDEVFVVNFNEKVAMGLPATAPFSGDVQQLKAALARSPAEGRTALYDALVAALRQLEKGSRDKKALVVFSDGGDNCSADSLQDVLELASRPRATIYTIGLYDSNDEDRNPRVLKRLASMTGGVAFLPPNMPRVNEVCRQIARDLRSQYTIGYVPSRKPDGTYRTIQVNAASPDRRKLSVRTRSGYRAEPR